MLQGNFQYLGAMRFPAGANKDHSIVSMDVLVPNTVPDSLRILFFSDQPASFAMVLADCMFVVMRLASSIVCCVVIVCGCCICRSVVPQQIRPTMTPKVATAASKSLPYVVRSGSYAMRCGVMWCDARRHHDCVAWLFAC